jgi:hypothetical protein
MISFNLKNPRAVDYLKKHGEEFLIYFDNKIRFQLNRLIIKAIDEGWSYKRTAEVIIERFPSIKYDQALQTVIYVTGNAFEQSSLDTAHDMQSAGLQMVKLWDSIGDDHVCEKCKQNEKISWIPLNNPFPTGHQRPLAHDGCRCSMKTKRSGS